jgi:hypothetical protein
VRLRNNSAPEAPDAAVLGRSARRLKDARLCSGKAVVHSRWVADVLRWEAALT